MALTTALFTSLSGLDASSQMLSVAGNNISNVNTTAFKRSRATFQTQILSTLGSASAPSARSGGTNPSQVGLGVKVASINRDFTTGSLQPTGVSTDMAIDGDGLFTVNVAGVTRFTRDGNFILDSEYNLVSSGTGGIVQGFGVDENYNIIPGVLQDVTIPIGVQTIAEATSEVRFAGNLNAGGDAATQGSITDFEQLFEAGGGTPITAGSALAGIEDSLGTTVFSTGDVITIQGATKGGATIPTATFEIGPTNTTDSEDFGTTVQDLMDFLDNMFGIDTNLAGGVSVTGGVISIEGNTGTANGIGLQSTNFLLNQSSASPTTPLTFEQVQQADGESTRTAFVAFDSLGNEIVIDLSIVLENKDATGTQWRFYADSAEDTDLDRFLGSGTISFDTNGQFISEADNTIIVNRDNTGAENPMQVTLSFIDPFGSTSALVDTASNISAVAQDGSQPGTLTDFTVSEDGTITGIFSNSLLRTIGQIPLATFANYTGLEEVGANLFRASANSGEPQVTIAATSDAGKIVGRALELSNVDLAQEFTDLIIASTGFSANSRVLTTSDRMIQELIASIR